MSVSVYLAPSTVDECLGVLTEYEGQGRLIAGGTDVMPGLTSGKYHLRALIDTTRIEGLDRIDLSDGEVVVGAGVTHAQVKSHPGLANLLPVLTQACGSIGSPQIRNVATLAGNVVNAQPAADGAMALVALGATAEIVSVAGKHRVPVEDLYAGLGQSRVNPARELLTAFFISRPRAGQGSAYGRISPRNALCLPIVNVAAFVALQDGRITEARLAMGPVAERPFRPKEAEACLLGAEMEDEEAFALAALVAARASSPRDSCLRGCSDYRKQLIRVLAGRVIAQAAARAEASLRSNKGGM
jgi:CO/xanthine dehydrogenase FAD-binding subunit